MQGHVASILAQLRTLLGPQGQVKGQAGACKRGKTLGLGWRCLSQLSSEPTSLEKDTHSTSRARDLSVLSQRQSCFTVRFRGDTLCSAHLMGVARVGGWGRLAQGHAGAADGGDGDVVVSSNESKMAW